jgi:hypothetical protein
MSHPLIAPAASLKPMEPKPVVTVKVPSVPPPTLIVKSSLPVTIPLVVAKPPINKVSIPLPSQQYSQPISKKKTMPEVKPPSLDKRFQADPKYKPVVTASKKPIKNKAVSGTVPTMKSSVQSVAPTGKGMNLVVVAAMK